MTLWIRRKSRDRQLKHNRMGSLTLKVILVFFGIFGCVSAAERRPSSLLMDFTCTEQGQTGHEAVLVSERSIGSNFEIQLYRKDQPRNRKSWRLNPSFAKTDELGANRVRTVYEVHERERGTLVPVMRLTLNYVLTPQGSVVRATADFKDRDRRELKGLICDSFSL